MPGHYGPSGFARQSGTERFLPFDTGRPRAIAQPPGHGKLIKVNQKENTGDLRMADGSIVRNVNMASPFGGTDHGMYRAMRITNTIPDANETGTLDIFKKSDKQDTYVIVTYIDGNLHRPFITGQVMPQINQMTNENISYIDRHHTDDVHLITDYGDSTDYAPDFTGMTRTPDPTKWNPQAHDPGMGGFPNFDANTKHKWKVINEGDQKYALTLRQQSSDVTAFFHPDGRFQIHKGDGGGGTLAAIEMHGDGHITLHSTSGHTFDAPMHVFTGRIYANAGIDSPADIKAMDIQSPSGGVPGPLGAAGGGGSAGTPVPHDFPLATPPDNPNTGKRGD